MLAVLSVGNSAVYGSMITAFMAESRPEMPALEMAITKGLERVLALAAPRRRGSVYGTSRPTRKSETT